MEPTQLISEEWGSLSGLYTAEEADFMAQFLGGNYSVVTEKHCGNASFGMPSTFWHGHESTTVTLTGTNTNSCFPSNVTNANFLCFSQGSSSSNDSGSFQWNDKLSQQSIDEEPGLEPVKLILADNNLQAKRDHEMMSSTEEERNRNLENPTKRLRNSIENFENMRNAMPISNNEEGRREGFQRSCFSQVDSNASLELNGGASPCLSPKDPAVPNLYAKSRATNGGPATDAQSIYARKRRERINERLKILQSLVPNGTKVDISTMLEEAVQYVKFLQLQIKLLSSDDLWMYAPIAYNGMNIGLDLSSSPTKGR